jgi:acetylornithine/succinyldiaminopimelate/putrescine aminotransferase
VPAEGGVIIPAPGYLDALRERCTKTGTLLIFDEIQTGFGRTGDLFAFRKYGVIPDILTMAKALGGGMPLGALAASSDLMKEWQSNPVLGHITTFGGHPVSCAAALASLKLLLKEKWIDEVNEKSAIFVEALKDHPKVNEVRAAGLLIAVDLVNEDYAQRILPLLLDEGVLSDWFLFCPTAFRIAPPLSIEKSEAEEAAQKVLKALNRL